MAGFRVSRDAEESLIRIYIQSLKLFGRRQADRFEAGFSDVFLLIASQPGMGVRRDDLAEGYRRHVWKAHSIFYVAEAAGSVTIVDVLAPGEDPAHRSWPAEDEIP